MGFCPASEMLTKAMEVFCAKPKKTRPKNITMEEEEEEKEIEKEKKKMTGTVVLMKKNVLDFNDMKASFLDRIHELFGKGVSIQLISALHADPGIFNILYTYIII